MAEALCEKWILQYEAYRLWKQFERDGRADYRLERRWTMPTAKEIFHNCAGMGPAVEEFGCVIYLMAVLTSAIDANVFTKASCLRDTFHACRHVAGAFGGGLISDDMDEDWSLTEARQSVGEVLRLIFRDAEAPFLLAAAHKTLAEVSNLPAPRPTAACGRKRMTLNDDDDGDDSTVVSPVAGPSGLHAARTPSARRLVDDDADETTSSVEDILLPAVRQSTSRTPSARRLINSWTNDNETSSDNPVVRTPTARGQKRLQVTPGDSEHGVTPGKKRRTNQSWTPEDVEILRAGVRFHSTGQWALIRKGFFSASSRTAVDLKDKWRSLQREADRKVAAAAGKPTTRH